MMKFFYTIAIILFLQFLTYSQTPDNYEPNDDFTQAYNDILCNQIDLTISNSDIDIFSYDLTTEEITINLINVSNAITPKVTVYDNSYTEINSWTGNSGQNLYNTFTPPSSGLYYVKIEDIGSNTVLEPYNLILTNASCPLSSEAEILTYSIPDQISSEIISANNSVHVLMPGETNITNLVAEFTLSAGAEAKVGSTVQVSGSSSNDWSDNPVIYTVTAENGTDIREWSVYVDAAEGIDNINDDIFSVYPNPAAGEFYIKLNEADSKDINIEIIDMQGKIIKRIDNKNIAEIINCNLKNNGSGIYFIKVIFKNKILIKKLSIIR